jgi:hypothetical protein
MADKLPVEVTSYFGLPEDATLESLKQHHGENYIKKSEVVKDEKLIASVMGKTMNSERTAIRRELKTLGIELDPKETDTKNPSEIVSIGLAKAVENFEASKKELQGKIGQGVDEAVKEWKDKAEKSELKANDFKSKFETQGKDFETYKSTEKATRKTEKVEDIFKTAFAKIPKANNVTELISEGLEAHLRKNYKIDLEEDGKEFIADLKGERVKNPNKAGATLTVQELFNSVALEKKYSPIQEQQQRRSFTVENNGSQNGGGNQNQQAPQRKLSHKIK